MSMLNETPIPCKYCGDPTFMRGTKMCDRCFELERGLRSIKLEALVSILKDCGWLEKLKLVAQWWEV